MKKNEKWFSNKNIKRLAGMGFVFGLVLMGTNDVFADGDLEQTDTVNLTVNSVCSLSRSSGTGEYSATLIPGTLTTIGSSTFKAVCNDAGGWYLSAVGYTNDTEGNTNLHDSTNNLDIVTGTATSGDTSNYAMKAEAVSGTYTPTIKYASDYAAVPSTATEIARYNGITDQTEGSGVTVSYRGYVSMTQGAGSYTGKVKYTMAHPLPQSLDDITYMQDMTPEICSNSVKYETNDLEDSRDHKTYTVVKLEDGNCWMTQNLDLQLSTETTLTSADSNVSADWKPNNGTMTGSGTSCGSDWQNSNIYPYSCTFNDANYGTYYNWTAAIASNNSEDITTTAASDSICPKGWRLPTINSSTTEYGTLLYAAGIASSATGGYATGGYAKMIGNPYSFSLAGVVSGGTRSGSGSYGYYWSSSAYSSSYAYLLNFNSSSLYPQNYNIRFYGLSVRCLASS